MIIWLNGTFGVGKTATALELAQTIPNARLFDAETVGYLLMATLQDHEFSDFQDLPPWRTLVPVVTSEIARFTGQHLLATQSVLNETYWKELRQGFSQHALDVFHVVLHADPETLARRIGEIVMTPDGKTAYVVSQTECGIGDYRCTYTVTPINTATSTPGKPIHLPAGATGGIAITP